MLAMLLLGLTSTLAQAEDDVPGAQMTGVPVIQTTQVPFHVSSATCSHLPPGTTIEGVATEVSITTESTDRRGAKTIRNTTTAIGTGDDHNGHTYTVEYANQFRLTNTPRQPDRYSGRMTDLFVLAGNGPAMLDNGFDAELTAKADLSKVFSWNVREKFGDPISFKPGPFIAHCDPL
jgi:hypothetical protein